MTSDLTIEGVVCTSLKDFHKLDAIVHELMIKKTGYKAMRYDNPSIYNKKDKRYLFTFREGDFDLIKDEIPKRYKEAYQVITDVDDWDSIL